MDFIERLFGLSPDGGSGATEWMFLLIPVVAVALAAVRRYTRGTQVPRRSDALPPSAQNRD